MMSPFWGSSIRKSTNARTFGDLPWPRGNTAFISAEWVRSHPKRTALGLDLHAATLAWGRKWNIEPLGDQAHRLDGPDGAQ